MFRKIVYGGGTMENQLWDLFRETGDPMGYLLYRAQKKQGKSSPKQPKPPKPRKPAAEPAAGT